MEDIKRARTTLSSYLDYCKAKGWKVDSLESVLNALVRLDNENRDTEALLYKACLFLAKLDRHPSHLFWIKALDEETLERELGPDFDLDYFKLQYFRWRR